MQGLQELIEAYDVLPSDTKEALNKFRLSDDGQGDSSFAYNLNKAIRQAVMPSQWQALVGAMHVGFNTSQLSYPATVYRAVVDVQHLGPLIVGGIWRSSSFVSTSLSWTNLHTHLKPDCKCSTGAVLTLRLPSGTPAVFLGKGQSTSSETELILPPDLNFRIIGVSDASIEMYVNIPHVVAQFVGFKEIIMQRS